MNMYMSTTHCVYIFLIISSLQYYTLLKVEAHSCGGCDKSKCNKTISCPGSVVKDNCGFVLVTSKHFIIKVSKK